jgi:hypothetical protein
VVSFLHISACGNNLTRDNVMKRAADLHNLALPMLLPGSTISIGEVDVGSDKPTAPDVGAVLP